MPKIFISYARDKSCGQKLAAESQVRLEAAGFDVFRDVIDLQLLSPGELLSQPWIPFVYCLLGVTAALGQCLPALSSPRLPATTYPSAQAA